MDFKDFFVLEMNNPTIDYTVFYYDLQGYYGLLM